MARSRAMTALTIAIGAAAALLAARTTSALLRFAVAAPELPLWDEAKYGLDGARLAAALAHFDVPRWAKLIYGMDVWPPLFPLAESAVFGVAGNGFAVARGLVAVLFFCAALAMYWAGREIAPDSPAVGAIAGALVIASPFTQLFAVQAMLEIPGMLLYALALAAYARFLRRGTRRWVVVTGVLTAAVFFTKYNYGLLWIAPLLLSEAWIACGGAGAALARTAALAKRIDWRRPFTIFVAASAAAIAAIAVTGGGTMRVGGASLSVTGIGNPLQVLIAIVLVRACWRPRRAWGRFRDWERGLAERHRVLLWTAVAPITIWLLLTPHLRSLVDFVENRSAGPPPGSAAWLLFYPRVFVTDYHAARWLGVVVGLLALAALGRIAALGRVGASARTAASNAAAPAVRVVLLAVAVSLAGLTIHPYKEPRFLLIAAPVLWLAAAWNATTLAQDALASLRVPSGWTSAALAIGAFALLTATPATAPSLPSSFAGYTVDASARPVVDHIVELAARRPTLVLGTWNQASPALIEWRFLQSRSARHDGAEAPEVVVPSRRGGSAERIVRRLADAGSPDQIVLLDVDRATAPSPEWAAAFAAETAWLEPVRRQLDGGAAPYAPAHDLAYVGSGYRVIVYGRVAGTGLSRVP